MRKLLIICLVVAWSLTGCYEDKGHYDYRELVKVTIENVNNSYNLSPGDTLIIQPDITFGVEGKVGLKYEWLVDLDSLIFREKDVEYIIPADAAAQETWVLRVTDTVNDLTYMKQTFVNVRSLFTEGFLILSEKNGVSSFSFLRRGTSGEWDRFMYDIYEDAEGTSLEGKPVQMFLHDLGRNGTAGEHIMLLQDDFFKCMDLEADNLTKSLELSKEFQVIPQNIKPKQVFYSDWFSFLLDEDGRVFARKNFSSDAFHSGYFSQYPMVYEKPDKTGEEFELQELKVDRFVYEMDPYIGYVLAYEKERKRFMFLRGSSSYGTIGEADCANYPDGFIRLDNLGDNELIASSGCYLPDGYYSNAGLFNIIKRTDGSYVGQIFNSDAPENMEAISQQVFKGGILNDNVILLIPDFCSGRGGLLRAGCPFSFIASGNVLYYFSKEEENKDGISLSFYYEFPAEITAIEDEWSQNRYICVGLANGEVYLLNIEQGTDGGFNKPEARFIVKMDKNVGRVKQIIYRK